MAKTIIGIIGFGRFGKVLHRLFADGFDILVSSSSYRNGDLEGVSFAPLPTVAERSTALFLTVPINRTAETAERIRPFLKPGQLVVDVCSVKEWPYGELKRALAGTGVLIWPTHPMFGPDSAQSGFDGLNWVSCEEDIDPAAVHQLTEYLQRKGLVIVRTTCEAHDRMAAETQGLTHFIGRFLDEIGIAPTPIDTLGYKRLLAVKEQTCHDTWELFCDLQHYNRFSVDIKRRLQDAIFKVTSRFLDTTIRRETPVLGFALQEGSAEHLAIAPRVRDEFPEETSIYQFDSPEALLEGLSQGDIDGVVLPLSPDSRAVKETLDAMGKHSFNPVDVVDVDREDGASRRFVIVKRRRWKVRAPSPR